MPSRRECYPKAPQLRVLIFELGQLSTPVAEAAVAVEPDNLAFLNTLSVAQYRNGRYRQACATVARCDELRRHQNVSAEPLEAGVLAVALFKLGRIAEARVMFKRLEGLMSDEKGRDDEEASVLFEEVKQLLEGPGPRTGPLDSGRGGK